MNWLMQLVWAGFVWPWWGGKVLVDAPDGDQQTISMATLQLIKEEYRANSENTEDGPTRDRATRPGEAVRQGCLVALASLALFWIKAIIFALLAIVVLRLLGVHS